jgi:hypothetical protein
MAAVSNHPSGRPLRFPSKRDMWVMVLIWGAALAIVFIGGERLVSPGPVAGRLIVGGLCVGLAAFTVWLLYSTSYEIGPEKLIIRTGPIRRVVKLESIEGVAPSRSPLSSPALSLDRLRVRYRGGGFGVLISPEDKRGFLRALVERCPQLELTGDRAVSRGEWGRDLSPLELQMKKRCAAWNLIAAALLLGACGSPATEGDHAGGLPGEQEVFSAAQEAMGGSGRLGEVESISAIADCVSPGGPYTTEILSARGGRTWFKQASAGEFEYLAIVNGAQAWSPNADGSVTRMDEGRIVMITGHEFQMIAIDIGPRFSDAGVEALEEFSGSECVRVRMTDTRGEPLDAYFHTSTHLLAGMRLSNPMREGEDVWIRLIEWTTVDGVKLPSKIIATDSSGDFILSFHEISLNDVDESVFEVPAELLDD